MNVWGFYLLVYLCVMNEFMYLLCRLKNLGSSSSHHCVFFLLPLITPLTGDTSTSPLPLLHHSRDNAPPHCLLSLCPRGSGSPVSSAASPLGGGAPWSPPGHRCCPGTTWVIGTTPWRCRPFPQLACWNSPYWSSAVLSDCWPCHGIKAQLHSDCDLEEKWRRSREIYSKKRRQIKCKFKCWTNTQQWQ